MKVVTALEKTTGTVAGRVLCCSGPLLMCLDGSWGASGLGFSSVTSGWFLCSSGTLTASTDDVGEVSTAVGAGRSTSDGCDGSLCATEALTILTDGSCETSGLDSAEETVVGTTEGWPTRWAGPWNCDSRSSARGTHESNFWMSDCTSCGWCWYDEG